MNEDRGSKERLFAIPVNELLLAYTSALATFYVCEKTSRIFLVIPPILILAIIVVQLLIAHQISRRP